MSTIPEELKVYGLTDEVMSRTVNQFQKGETLDWKLRNIPKVSFYQSLHPFLKKQSRTFKLTTKDSLARFYMKIDPFLEAKGTRPDNCYRFIEGLLKLNKLSIEVM